MNAVSGQCRIDNVTGVHIIQEVRIADLLPPPRLRGVIEQIEERSQEHQDGDPDGELLQVGVHHGSYDSRRALIRSRRDMRPARTPRSRLR